MKYIKILVQDNPNTGVCDIVDHWKEVLRGRDTFNGAAVAYDDNAQEDSVIVFDQHNNIVARFDDGEALRIDEIVSQVDELDIATISWEDFKKKYAV